VVVTVDRRWVRRVLLAVVALLVLASLVVQLGRDLLHFGTLGGFVSLLDVNGEGNLPSYYSALTLLAAAALFAVTGLVERPASVAAGRRWFGLAMLAAAASLDEAVGLHETAGDFVRRAVDPGGYLFYVWVVPAALVVVAVALAYRRFVAGLPAPTRRALTLGAGLWAGSALLIELVEGRIIASSGGFPTFELAAVGTLQEAGEMLGVVLIVDGLLGHLADRGAVGIATFRPSGWEISHADFIEASQPAGSLVVVTRRLEEQHGLSIRFQRGRSGGQGEPGQQ
jgi:hypothetical protein